MAIKYEESSQTFTLETKHSTYQMMIDRYGSLLHLYYGSRVEGSMEYLLTYRDRGFSGNPYKAGADRSYSYDALPQEYPAYGTGDYRNVCLSVQQENGICASRLIFAGYEIRDGKYGLEGLPAVYANEQEAQTLEVFLRDEVTGIKVCLKYGVLPEPDIITRSQRITNEGEKGVTVKKAQTVCLDFLYGSYDFIQFYGRHAMERNLQRTPIAHGETVIGSRRGTSSHQYNPFVIIAQEEANEDYGECYGLSFVYSGNFQAAAERDQFDQTRIVMGLSEERFDYTLKVGEHLDTPEIVMAYSGKGLTSLSHSYHKVYREHLCRGKYKLQRRPVLINNWEATYFQFTGDKLIQIAEQAAELGVEMLVLDDGWFGKRDSDNSSLGDWNVNEKKLGGSLRNLSEKINEIGLLFGIWMEPEMISEDSDLYRKNPEWAFQLPDKKPIRSRNQLVLDFSRKDVVDYVYQSICGVLDSANISYVKWDMNRSIADIYSALAGNQQEGKILYQYVLGLYDLLERMLSTYPDLLIEGCSGGGGRFDAGMLYYTPQIWCSDNTDAINRIKIQYGTSFGYPISAVGSHVSASPNHQTGRETSMHTRGVVAMSGSFGYELDLNHITKAEKNCVKKQIKEYKKYWRIIHEGQYYRLTNPFKEQKIAAWEFISNEREQVLVNVVAKDSEGNQESGYIRLKGIHPEYCYKEELTGKVYSGSALLSAGMPIPKILNEYEAWQCYLVKC